MMELLPEIGAVAIFFGFAAVGHVRWKAASDSTELTDMDIRRLDQRIAEILADRELDSVLHLCRRDRAAPDLSQREQPVARGQAVPDGAVRPPDDEASNAALSSMQIVPGQSGAVSDAEIATPIAAKSAIEVKSAVQDNASRHALRALGVNY